MKKFLFFISLIANTGFSQELIQDSNTKRGEISFGIRSTGSMFSESDNYFGIGAGWQVRYRMSERLNTEWFFDWITTDIGGLGLRYDAHIGESMIIYPFKRVGDKNRFTPYILGGFCGDYTKIETNLYWDDSEGQYTRDSNDRWSFATQLGLGTHFNITDRFDLSLSTQYVLHFGRDIHTEVFTNSHNEQYLNIHELNESSLEGHLFLTLSANFVIADLAKKK